METEDTQIDYKSESDGENMCKEMKKVQDGHKLIPKICDTCGKAFPVAGKLKRHINAVHGQKDHKCAKCEKQYSTAQVLTNHISAVHNGQKDHKCDSCEKAFSQAGDLKKHINISSS